MAEFTPHEGISSVVRIDVPGREQPVFEEPEVRLSSSLDTYGFCDEMNLCYGYPLMHRTTVCVDLSDERNLADEEMEDADEVIDALIKSGLVSEEGEISVASSLIVQLSSRIREMADSWYSWLSNVPGELSVLGTRLDEIEAWAEQEGDDALRDGSAFYVAHANVHPHFRGQGIGLRAITHALWLLSDQPSDMVFVSARPRRCWFSHAAGTDTDEPAATSEAVSGLERYFGRLGLAPSYPSRIEGEPLLMEARLRLHGFHKRDSYDDSTWDFD